MRAYMKREWQVAWTMIVSNLKYYTYTTRRKIIRKTTLHANHTVNS